MLRLAAFALLGCSFLTVQAHVLRERTLSTPGIELATRPVSRSGRSDSKVPGLGAGTTRALHEASETGSISVAPPSLALGLPRTLVSSQSQLALTEVPPVSGAAPPILRV
jgi:hypothetical protein